MTITVPIKHVVEILNLEETDDIKSQLEQLYSDINTEVEGDNLIISIDDIHLLKPESYNQLIKLCDNGKLDKALDIAEDLYPDYKKSSELNRIIAQIQLSKDNFKATEHYLIEALKLNPKNTNALILMGNLQYRKNETDTALMYWNSALRFDPDDYLSLSNIGSTLAKDNHLEKARYFFEQALSVKKDYANALLGLGIINNKEDKYLEAFDCAIKVLKSNDKKSPLYSNAYNLAMSSAKDLISQSTYDVEEEIYALKVELEKASGKPIEINSDSTIKTPAKIVIAEYHNKDKHQLLYKNTDVTVHHLILHELYHLKLVTDARGIDKNMLFTSHQKHQDAFFKRNHKHIQKLKKQGVDSQQIDKIIISVFQGLNSQIYNTPIDLFIEDLIYKQDKNIRPLQCMSLVNLVKQGIEATTSEVILKTFPKHLISSSKILNIINALQLKDLYGIDMIDEFKANKIELNKANILFEEFIEYRYDKEPAEEYEIITHWAEDLKLDKYFKLQKEPSLSTKTADEVIDEITKDPYGLDSPEPQYIIDERQKFIDQHANDDTNKAVTFYMIGAINLLSKKPTEEVKKIAMEFAYLGMTGIDVKKDNYEVPSLAKKMSGYQTLAYYYVSWAIAIPDMLSQLQLPFDKEYGIAIKMVK